MDMQPEDLKAMQALAPGAERFCREGRLDLALRELELEAERVVLPTLAAFLLKVKLQQCLGHPENAAVEYVAYGCRAVDCGLIDLGLEAISSGLIVDVAHGYHRLLHDPATLIGACERYEKVAAGMRPPQGAGRLRAGSDPRVRVGMIVPNLVDHTVAYSNRVMFFARYLDRSQFDLRVYVTENASSNVQTLPVKIGSPPTVQRAPEYLAELRQRHIPVYIAPHGSTFRARAAEVAGQIAADDVDVLILQAGPTMAVDWLATRLSPCPVKLQVHIGLSAYQRGIDATLFDNAVNMEREAATWPAWAGRQMLVRRGTDLEALDAQRPLPRESLGLPEGAVLIGVLSNHLARRMSPVFLETIGDVLQAVPDAWFVPIGSRQLPNAIWEPLRRRGVADRVRLIDPVRRAGVLLKMLDLYANEFPTGGSQSVIEAMACGLPVVALRAGSTHHESVGADIVGAPYAIAANDPAAYRDRLVAWAADPSARREAGRAMRQRAEREFSVRDYVRRVGELAVSLLRSGRAASAAA